MHFAALEEHRYTDSMKVEVEKHPGLVSKLQIELPPEDVAKEWDAIANSFARVAKISQRNPGGTDQKTRLQKLSRSSRTGAITCGFFDEHRRRSVRREQIDALPRYRGYRAGIRAAGLQANSR